MTEKEGPWAREYRNGRAEQVEQQRIANLIELSKSEYLSQSARETAILVAYAALFPVAGKE